jgi:hypothetical protein
VDLTGVMLRAGAARPHVLIAAMPGGTAVRLAAEQELRRRGWPTAMTPADADVLLVAGDPAASFAAVLDATWRATPAPRARAQAGRPGEVPAVLETARARLRDRSSQQALAADTGHDAAQHGDGAAGGHEPAVRDRDHHGHEMGAGDAAEMGGGAHYGHDMGGMAMPAGLPMADRATDRDGLRLDQLHVPLGPILPDWPAGLVVHLTLQGDVVQHAEAQALGPGGGISFWTEPWRRAAAGESVTAGEAARRRTAADLDSLGRFLAVAGWDDAAAAARRLRDDTLAGVPGSRLQPALRRFARRIARSRTLAWLTRGLGVLPPDDAPVAGAAGPAVRVAGDVTARYRRWCAELADAAATLDDGSPLGMARTEPLDDTPVSVATLLATLPRLLNGAELAAARLIIASLDPDLDDLPALAASSHGH